MDPKQSRFYVVDSKGCKVSAWSLTGQFLFNFESNTTVPLTFPMQAAVNSLGDIYVVHWGVKKVLVYGSDGKYKRSYGDEGAYAGQFMKPKGVAIDSDDNVYISDMATSAVQIFSSQDQMCLWIHQGINGAARDLRIPLMLAMDSQNRIFIPEYGNNRVQIWQYVKATK